MKKTTTWQLFLTLFILPFFFTSCVDDFYKLDNVNTDTEVDMTLVGPIGHSNIKLSDILPDSISRFKIFIENDSIFFVLKDTVDFGNAFINDIKMPKGTFYKDLPLGESTGINTDTAVFDYTLPFQFDINTNPNEILDSILFKSSDITLKMNSVFDFVDNSTLEVIFDPTQLKLNPSLYPDNKIIINLHSGLIEQPLNLEGAKLYFPNRANTINIRFKGDVTTSTQFVEGTTLSVELDFNSMKPRIAYGYIGQDRDIWGDEILRDFDFTQSLQGSNFFLPFHNPQIYITSVSNIGIPAEYTLDYVKASDTRTGETVYADFNGQPTTSFVLNYPKFAEIKNLTNQQLLNFNTSTLDKQTTKLFDKDYGATNRLFQIKPNKLAYKFRVKTVADAQAPVHFFFDDSKMFLLITTKLQVNFDGSEDPDKSFFVNLKDTMKLGIDSSDVDISDFEKVAAEIKLNYQNSLPIGADVTLKFLNDSDEEVTHDGEVFRQQYTIEPAPVDAEGKVLTPFPNTIIRIKITGKQMKNFVLGASKMAFEYSMAGNEGKNVQIMAKDWLDLKASFYVAGKVTLNDEK